MSTGQFGTQFEILTGNLPFPWQAALYEQIKAGKIPARCNLPTGLGKTSVVAVWLIVLAEAMRQGVRPLSVPRRLVYVVNRRTVVDQTTSEVIKLRDNAHKLGIEYLAISTLRGQFADNREWSADPSRPAVICGTVDMIGSRLLFSGYRVGFKAKPLHAGFLGQDALLVHDEAHLEPAFQALIDRIRQEQKRCNEFTKLRVMELTATTRSDNGQTGEHEDRKGAPFGLTDEERNPPKLLPDPPTEPIHHVWRRIKAKKQLCLTPVDDDAQAAGEIAEIATGYKDKNAAVLVFVRTLETVAAVEKELKKTNLQVVLLTGTMRGMERDRLVEKPAFKRFLKGAEVGETVYLVCTSAGEVGIDISADHLVCDLSTLESMAQRFGRVNRYGDRDDTRIDVVYPAQFDDKDKLSAPRKATLEQLSRLQGDASPKALGEKMASLSDEERKSAFAPEPTILPTTDILFDAWALTSIRDRMPGRPPVEPYLHGIAEWQPPETYVAWRQEVEIISDELQEQYPPADLLDSYPLKPRELLRDATDRRNTGVFAQLGRISQRCPDAIVWVVDDLGGVRPAGLKHVTDGDSRRLHGATVLLPPSIGGLSTGGMLKGDEPYNEQLKYDVADSDSSAEKRVRVWSDDPEVESKTADMRRVRSIEIESPDDDDEPRRWEWFESIPLEGGSTAKKAVIWKTHVDDVVCCAKRIVAGLSLSQELADAVILAAELHDHGKRRERFQVTLGNRCYPDVLWAKAGKRGARLPEPFRHEFGSLLDASADERYDALSVEMKDLVLHLIAAHHGRARPHFALDEAFDPEHQSRDAEAMAVETPRRFARLQRKYGRWGLAYLESLLRAADWAASAEPTKVLDVNGHEVSP